MAHRSEYGLLIDAHCLYIIGGLRADVAVRNVQMFSFKTRDWSNLPSMRTPRQGAGAVMHKGRIYVFSGGTESAQPLQYSECYDPGSNAWTALPPMPVGCFKPAVISHGDHIFLFGGYMSLDDSRCCCRVQRFDTLSNEWIIVWRFILMFLYLIKNIKHILLILERLCSRPPEPSTLVRSLSRGKILHNGIFQE